MEKDFHKQFVKCFRLHFIHNVDKLIKPTIKDSNLQRESDNQGYIPKIYIRSEGTIQPTNSYCEAKL